MISPRLIRKLERLSDNARRHIEESVDLLLEMPDQVRPLQLVQPDADPGVDHWEQRLVRLNQLPRKTMEQLVAVIDTVARHAAKR